MNSIHQINGRQLTYIITGGQVGTGVLALPSLLSQEAGQHAWMCILLGVLVPFINLLVIEKLGSRHSGLNMVGAFREILGKVGGTIAAVAFAGYLIASITVLVNAFARFIQVYMLPRTPLWVIIFLGMICVVYAGLKGGRVVGRINETLFFGLVLSMFFIVIPTYYNHEFTNLLPLGELNAAEMLRGTFLTMYTFAGVEILLVLYSQVDKPEEVKGAALKGLGLSTATYFIITICCLLVFGPERIVHYTWPGVSILKAAQVPVVERFEFYFLAIWVGIVLRRAIIPVFAAALTLAQLFKREERSAPVVLAVGLIVFCGGLLAPSTAVNYILIKYFALAYLAMGFAFPLLLLLISWLRQGVNANA